jgi:hypothetical protein
MKTIAKAIILAALVLALVDCGDISLRGLIAQKEAAVSNPPKVLVILCNPFVPAAKDRMINTLAGFADIKSVTYFDGGFSTPTVAQLQTYDVVFMASDQAAWDMPTLCDNLAQYLDGGGRVILSTFDFQPSPSWQIVGRLMSQYSPLQTGGPSLYAWATLATYAGSHPIMAGVASLTAYWRDNVSLSTGATGIAYWSDGYPLVAEKGYVIALDAAIEISSADALDGWAGDGWTLLHNAIVYIAHKW